MTLTLEQALLLRAAIVEQLNRVPPQALVELFARRDAGSKLFVDACLGRATGQCEVAVAVFILPTDHDGSVLRPAGEFFELERKEPSS